MKTKVTLLIVVALVMATTLSFAGETTTKMAKKELYSDITDSFNKEVGHWDNFFYESGIDKIKEELQVSFVVNQDQSLSLIRVIADNPDAKDFVKYVFKTKKMQADEVLVGKAYTFNLYLRYEAN